MKLQSGVDSGADHLCCDLCEVVARIGRNVKRHILTVHLTVITMSQYKVLPPYSEEDNSFVNFSLSYSSDDAARHGAGGQQVRRERMGENTVALTQ
jgi:hypothetical protein